MDEDGKITGQETASEAHSRILMTMIEPNMEESDRRDDHVSDLQGHGFSTNTTPQKVGADNPFDREGPVGRSECRVQGQPMAPGLFQEASRRKEWFKMINFDVSEGAAAEQGVSEDSGGRRRGERQSFSCWPRGWGSKSKGNSNKGEEKN